MNIYNDKNTADIKLIKLNDDIIYCHKSILSRNEFFMNSIKFSGNDTLKLIDIVNIFDEKYIIQYIEYLYDINNIDYNDIINFMKFLDYISDNVFKFEIDKVNNWVDILTDFGLSDNIVKIMVRNVSFKDIINIGNLYEDDKIINRLLNYKRGNYSIERKYLNNIIDNQSNTFMIKLYHTLSKDSDFQHMVFDSLPNEKVIKLIEKNIISRDSYISNEIPKNTQIKSESSFPYDKLLLCICAFPLFLFFLSIPISFIVVIAMYI